MSIDITIKPGEVVTVGGGELRNVAKVSIQEGALLVLHHDGETIGLAAGAWQGFHITMDPTYVKAEPVVVPDERIETEDAPPRAEPIEGYLTLDDRETYERVLQEWSMAADGTVTDLHAALAKAGLPIATPKTSDEDAFWTAISDLGARIPTPEAD